MRVVDTPQCNRCQFRRFLKMARRGTPLRGVQLPDVAHCVAVAITSPPELCLLSLVGQLVPDCFQVFVGFLQAGAGLVDGFEDGNVVDSDARFPLMFSEELLNADNLLSQSFLCRLIHFGIDLVYEVVPRDVAHDGNDMPAFLPVQKIETTCDDRDEQQRTED